MQIHKTQFKDLLILEPKVYSDERGYFFESFRSDLLSENGISIDFKQDNEALSQKNTFRGFHYQLEPYGQTKLVRVIQGAVLDIVIDIRPDSQTYGQVFQIELNSTNKLQLFVPKGFAHGYLCLEDQSIFSYKVDGFYHRESEAGISYLDPFLNIQWPVDPKDFIVSDKDKKQPIFGQHKAFNLIK